MYPSSGNIIHGDSDGESIIEIENAGYDTLSLDGMDLTKFVAVFYDLRSDKIYCFIRPNIIVIPEDYDKPINLTLALEVNGKSIDKEALKVTIDLPSLMSRQMNA